MTATEPRQRRPRADARRNYERLLTEADAAFRADGTGASLEGIARRSEVAIGTLYSHFPNRRALLGALLRDRHETLFAFADELFALPSAGEALTIWVRAAAAHTASYRGLVDVLSDVLFGGVDDEASELHAACARMTGISQRLVDTARAAGDIRADVTGDDVFALMNAAAWIRVRVSPDRADRLLRLTMVGFGYTEST